MIISKDITYDEKLYPVKYSFCTLVTSKKQYQEMLETILNAGFDGNNAEFLFIDNSEKNVFEAFRGIKHFLEHAQGQYIILCHQDLLFLHDREEDLNRKLKDLNEFDPEWIIAGNAGGGVFRERSICVTHHNGKIHKSKNFPFRAKSVDENLIILNHKWSPTISIDLNGFHLYGTELCKVASLSGHAAYVINFHVKHMGAGRMGDDFLKVKKQIIKKYARKLKTDCIQTTCTRIVLTSGNLKSMVFNSPFFISIFKRFFRIRRVIKSNLN